jgi:uncharacterized protein DUF4833
MLRRPTAPVFALVLLLLPLASWGDPRVPPGRTLPLFTIAKSENKNQVQYEVRVDDRCAPLGAAPVFAYWRMREHGPDRTEPLLDRELPAYGLSTQSLAAPGAAGGKVHIVLRAVPARPIEVATWRDADGECRASATLVIGGSMAHLFDVYAKLKWPWGIDYLLLQGWSLDGSRVVREVLRE